MTHGFDDQGRKVDSGNLRDWWTKKGTVKFMGRRGGAILTTFSPLDSVHVNGKLTMGGNLADLERPPSTTRPAFLAGEAGKIGQAAAPSSLFLL
jgi:hypothetical protein